MVHFFLKIFFYSHSVFVCLGFILFYSLIGQYKVEGRKSMDYGWGGRLLGFKFCLSLTV